jgi:hypothetical protein
MESDKCTAEEFLRNLGRIIRKIDDKMMKENKSPIGAKVLGKEKILINDVIKIVNKIAPRFILYLDERDREKLEISSLSEGFWKEMEDLEKYNKIKFLIFVGYLEKYEKNGGRQ